MQVTYSWISIPTAKSWYTRFLISSSVGGNELMIFEKITPIIGRGAPDAIASTIALTKMNRDWRSCRGLKRAIYEEPVLLTKSLLGKRWRGFTRLCHFLDLPSSSLLVEGVIGFGRAPQKRILSKGPEWEYGRVELENPARPGRNFAQKENDVPCVTGEYGNSKYRRKSPETGK
jgi:hypothetical protein